MLNVISWDKFVNVAINGKGVICFGAGKELRKLCEKKEPQTFFDNIVDIIDNDKKKQGTIINLKNKSYRIKSVNELCKDNLEGKCILITMVYEYFDVIEQLKIMGLYENTDIYLFHVMCELELENNAMNKELPPNIRLSDKMLIPKKIHYCWFGGNPIPDKYKKWMESWNKYCPDYDIIEWNESNYDYTKNKYMYQAYKMKKWGFVPDYARFDIIYQYGGIYLDTDVELVSNLDDMLYQNAFAGFESNNYVAFGLGFGAQKGNRIIKELMNDYDNREFIKSDGMLDMTASPVIQTEILKKKGLICNGEYQTLDDITIFPEKMLCGKSPSTRRVRLKPYTKSIHHYDGSWLEDDIKKKIMDVESGLKDII